jgi:hypothetical protein
VWLKLALAYVRAGDTQSAELALSEANLCDPENAAVWGHLALLALQQVSVRVVLPLRLSAGRHDGLLVAEGMVVFPHGEALRWKAVNFQKL